MFSVACYVGFASCKTFGKQPKRPCFGRSPKRGEGGSPTFSPARTPGVYAQRLCTMQSQQSIHSPSPRGRGLGIRQGCRDRTPKGFARTQSPQSVLIGIENSHYLIKKDFFYKLYPRLLMQSGVNIKCDDYLYLPFWIFFINCRCDISPVLTFQESSCSSFQLL